MYDLKRVHFLVRRKRCSIQERSSDSIGLGIDTKTKKIYSEHHLVSSQVRLSTESTFVRSNVGSELILAPSIRSNMDVDTLYDCVF